MTLTVEQIEDWRTTFCEVYPQEYHAEVNMLCDMALAVAKGEVVYLTVEPEVKPPETVLVKYDPDGFYRLISNQGYRPELVGRTFIYSNPVEKK